MGWWRFRRGWGGGRLAKKDLLMGVPTRVGKGDVSLGPDAAGLCISVLNIGNGVRIAGAAHFQFVQWRAVEGGFNGGGVEF